LPPVAASEWLAFPPQPSANNNSNGNNHAGPIRLAAPPHGINALFIQTRRDDRARNQPLQQETNLALQQEGNLAANSDCARSNQSRLQARL